MLQTKIFTYRPADDLQNFGEEYILDVYKRQEYAHELIIAFGPDRVMFGTDYPVKYCDDELKRFAELPLAAEERDDILWNNAHKYILGE